jgi:Tfp pilus assembly protein FimV
MSDFFGKLKSGAEKVAFEADKMNRLNRAKGELEKVKSQLQGEFTKLGEIYYSNRESGELSGPEYDQLCQAITTLAQQVEAKNVEVQKIDAEVYGAPAAQPASPAPSGQVQSQSATAASQDIPAEPVSAPTAAKTTKFCPNCGTEIPIETKFCTNCGSKV